MWLISYLPDPALQHLYTDMIQRRSQAFRPSTNKNHITMFRAYLSFCCHFNLRDMDPTPETVCLYAQFLTRTMQSPQTIQNYMSSISLLHKKAGMHTTAPSSFEVQMMIRAVKITVRHIPKSMLPITPDILYKICDICDQQGPIGLVLKTAFLISFFSFIRQSNLAPHSADKFDHTRHTARADVFRHPPGLVILLKWTKTMQSGQTSLIPIPAIKGHSHCPLMSYKKMCRVVPAPPDSPLLLLPGPHRTPVTISILQSALKVMIKALGHDPQQYSLHSLRRGGATASYHSGVDYATIQRHGTWTSDTFWRYITTDTINSTLPRKLAATFSSKLNHHKKVFNKWFCEKWP